MILEDIQLTGKANVLLPSLPLIDVCRINSKSLLNIKKMVETVDGDWYQKAVAIAEKEMTSDVESLLSEANQEVKKSKELLKTKYPKEYRKHFWSMVIRNPFKSLLAWLLTLRSTQK